MSRSGYNDDYEYINIYRATVERSISGKRGQAFLMELAKEMDAMPEKNLIAGDLVTSSGECCAIGVICKSRGLDVSKADIEDPDSVGKLVGISRSLAAEIEAENDEYGFESPGERWVRMRKWVSENLNSAPN